MGTQAIVWPPAPSILSTANWSNGSTDLTARWWQQSDTVVTQCPAALKAGLGICNCCHWHHPRLGNLRGGGRRLPRLRWWEHLLRDQRCILEEATGPWPTGGTSPSRAYSVMCSSLWAPKAPGEATRCHRDPCSSATLQGCFQLQIKWDEAVGHSGPHFTTHERTWALPPRLTFQADLSPALPFNDTRVICGPISTSETHLLPSQVDVKVSQPLPILSPTEQMALRGPRGLPLPPSSRIIFATSHSTNTSWMCE